MGRIDVFWLSHLAWGLPLAALVSVSDEGLGFVPGMTGMQGENTGAKVLFFPVPRRALQVCCKGRLGWRHF